MILFCGVCGEKNRNLPERRPWKPQKTLHGQDFIPKDIGVPHIYKKEKRKAFRLYQDALTKKIKKLKDQRRLGI